MTDFFIDPDAARALGATVAATAAHLGQQTLASTAAGDSVVDSSATTLVRIAAASIASLATGITNQSKAATAAAASYEASEAAITAAANTAQARQR